jgi:flagellar hook protein FlgE
MSLFGTLKTGASGLGVSSTALSVIGDNIANINTIGFKSGRAQFADYLPNTSGGLGGPVQIGTGAGTSSVSTMFGQGSLTDTDNALDMGISGDGFFIVSDGENDYYTRAGAFYLDDSGYIVTASGERLQGYSGTAAGNIASTLSDLQLDSSLSSQAATTEVVLDATLPATVEDDDTPLSTGTWTMDGTTAGGTIDDVTGDADHTTSVTIYDSLGVSHDVTVVFEQTGALTWSWYAIVDGEEVGGDADSAYQIASGDLGFDSDGALVLDTQTAATGWSFGGATAQSLSFDFGLNSGQEGSLTMSGDSDAFDVSSISQDGYAAGTLTSLAVDASGNISGTYDNGEEIVLGQVALATFDSLAGLAKVGGTYYSATRESGEPAIGAADSGSRGSVQGYALEASNVELEDQFVYMIEAQRSYQANARVVSTVNDTLAELVNLV